MDRIIFENATHRIIEKYDYNFDMDSLKGDLFNHEVNPEMDAEQLKTDESNFEMLVATEGVYGYVLEKKCLSCGTWEHVDSCWGFIGEYRKDSPNFEHYIVNEMLDIIKESE